jgi:hypothetical protein
MLNPDLLPSLESAVDALLDAPTTSSARLDVLADLLVEGLQARGLEGVRGGSSGEATVPGFGRSKAWDVSWTRAGKPRVLVSLKSILKNIGGTVPNRIDDLMGEVANVQLLHPEVVIGYAALLDEAANKPRSVDPAVAGDTWIDFFARRTAALAVRGPPAWGAGMIEGLWIVRIDSRQPAGHRLVDPARAAHEGAAFMDALAEQVRRREPLLFEGR